MPSPLQIYAPIWRPTLSSGPHHRAVPPRRWLVLFRRPAEDLSIRVRGCAYYLDGM